MLQIRQRIQRPRAVKLAEKWHQDVKKSHDVLEFLVTGRPPIGPLQIEQLKQSTSEYLRGWSKNHVQPSTECDSVLGALIDEHARRERLARGVAILACLYALSVPAATRYLASLIDIDVESYLRCITLAGQTNPPVLSGEELRSAQYLLRILSGHGQDFQMFQGLIEALVLGAPMTFIPLRITQGALERSGIRTRLQRQLALHLEQKQFMSVFSLTSWLRHVPGILTNNDIIAVLDKHFPSWPWLIAWRPNTDRIGRWERPDFTDVQRKKLSHAFDLDGPDTATHQQESLKMSEPKCYEHVHVQPQSTETLERFLGLLYRAHILGPGALELFIYFCIDNPPDKAALSTVDNGIKTGKDSHCSGLLSISQALSPHSTLGRQIRSFTRALPFLSDSRTRESLYLGPRHLAHRLSKTMEMAQAEFCAQLEKGTGEVIGMLVYDLGKAILQASWIHSDLSESFLAQIRQFPPQNTLEVIFDQLQDHSDPSNALDSRFKSYLASALGGRYEVGAGSMTLAAMQEEVQFWKHPPDSFRTDLAKTFAKFRRMDYSWYTSCLLVMLDEDDLFISEMRHMITLENEQSCLNFARYLAHRRSLNQLRHECWLLLLVSLVREQAPSFLQRMANSMSFNKWLEWVEDFTRLLIPVRSWLPQSGTALAQERLIWWGTLSQNKTGMRFLLERQGEGARLTWLYFASPLTHVRDLMKIIREGQNMMPIYHQIVAYLAPDGSNVATVVGCVRATDQTSTIGRAVCERILSRKEMAGKEEWPETGQAIVLEAWGQSRSLTQADKSALDIMKRLLKSSLPPQSRNTGYRSALERLQSEYHTLIHRARKLENLRLRVRSQRPEWISAILQRLGVDDTSGGRATEAGIPDELLDAVELVGEARYELSFALTGLSDLQRRARGISKDSRILLVRLCLQGRPQFCIHFSPDDDGQSQHNYWQPANNFEPESAICTKSLDLFTYYLGRNLHQLLKRGCPSLQSIYTAILKLITSPPDTCLVCSCSMGIKLWKPAACSWSCSIRLRKAPLQVRLHNLLMDTFSIDLLLTCVYAAAADPSSDTLLPRCPVKTAQLRAVINSFPPLASLQTAADLQAAIRGSGGYGKERENLMSWLCLWFRGFMTIAPDGFRVPSMPNTKQFLVVNSSHEKEKLFNAQPVSHLGSGVVFHGTPASRLFLILTEGLRTMTDTPLMLHGKSMGAGIYCGDNQATSLPFAGSTGQSWRNSALSNLSIMLGCELAAYGPLSSGSAHLIKDPGRLMVRYVFLLPQGYPPPSRHDVEPAMKSAFAKLRSGLLT